jgi:hypothetical protein
MLYLTLTKLQFVLVLSKEINTPEIFGSVSDIIKLN